jgi:hypothetical protein
MPESLGPQLWDKANHEREHVALTVVIEALEAEHIVVPSGWQCYWG